MRFGSLQFKVWSRSDEPLTYSTQLLPLTQASDREREREWRFLLLSKLMALLTNSLDFTFVPSHASAFKFAAWWSCSRLLRNVFLAFGFGQEFEACRPPDFWNFWIFFLGNVRSQVSSSSGCGFELWRCVGEFFFLTDFESSCVWCEWFLRSTCFCTWTCYCITPSWF